MSQPEENADTGCGLRMLVTALAAGIVPRRDGGPGDCGAMARDDLPEDQCSGGLT